MTFLYWIFDDTCVDVSNTGYVGVSENAKDRFSVHIRQGRVPRNSQYVILFEGARKECFDKELQLRPVKRVGWNNAVGGAQGFKVGFSHSEITKKKLSVAKLNIPQTSEHIAKRIASTLGQKRPKQSVSMSGTRNPMFGTKRPEYVIEAVRNSHLGKLAPNRQEIYCVGCRQKANKTTLAKYHKKCIEQ